LFNPRVLYNKQTGHAAIEQGGFSVFVRRHRYPLPCLLATAILGTLSATIVWTAEDAAAPSSGAYQPPTVEIVYVDPAPIIDGQLDDECWSQAARLEGFFVPDLEQPVPEETIALICADDTALYVAVICRDRSPEDIVSNETRRNGDIWDDDIVTFDVDPWHGHINMYSFQVTPRGTQCEDIPGGSATKIEWRGDWTASACRTPEGWQAEMAIPFAILRYPPGQDTFGVAIWRHFAQEQLWCAYPDMGRIYEQSLTANLVGLSPPAFAPRPLLMPYLTMDLGDFVGRRFDTGLDIQYSMPSGLTALASINPDFKQIEDVVEPISFSYSERYLSDPRPFFTTGQWGFLPREHLLYTRRIADFDAGLKLFGTVGRETIGLLNASTFGAENALAGAWRHQLDDQTYAKLLFVSHRLAGQPNNFAYGLDTGHTWRRPNGNDDLWLVLYQSQTQGAESGGAYAIGGQGSRSRGDGNFDYDWSVISVTEAFNPSLGYYPNTNYIGGDLGFGHWRRFEEGPIESRGWWISGRQHPYLDGSGMFQSAFSPSHWWTWRSGRHLSLGIDRSRRENQDSSGAYVYYAWNTRDTYREGSISVERGVRDGGTYTYYNLDQAVRPRDQLSLRLNAEYTHLSEPAADAGHDYQAVLTTSYDITPERCLAARGIWRDAGFSAFASYRQVVRRGMDAYVIIGDPDPDRTGFAERVVFKLIWVL
jgi:hypothetical protein